MYLFVPFAGQEDGLREAEGGLVIGAEREELVQRSRIKGMADAEIGVGPETGLYDEGLVRIDVVSLGQQL